MTTSRYSCGHFREQSCRFSVVRVIFGISKRVSSLCFRALSKMFSLFLGAHVSDN